MSTTLTSQRSVLSICSTRGVVWFWGGKKEMPWLCRNFFDWIATCSIPLTRITAEAHKSMNETLWQDLSEQEGCDRLRVDDPSLKALQFVECFNSSSIT
jgi:hypothetical protein